MAKLIYLKKDNDELISHCNCKEALISYPPQMDCPWCGCGWLFTCVKCRKAFTFARGVEVNDTWETLARRDIRGMGMDVTDEAVNDWVGSMKAYLDSVVVGQQYVALDGWVIPTNANSVEFDGWKSHHRLDFVPQVAALEDPSIIETVLGNVDYWELRTIGE